MILTSEQYEAAKAVLEGRYRRIPEPVLMSMFTRVMTRIIDVSLMEGPIMNDKTPGRTAFDAMLSWGGEPPKEPTPAELAKWEYIALAVLATATGTSQTGLTGTSQTFWTDQSE